MPENSNPPLHPLVKLAALGRFPDWTEAKGGRRKHMARVAKLLRGWAEKMGKPDREVTRWVAAGYLHDTFRDADPEGLRAWIGPSFRNHPGSVLHGPAAAQRLREEGVEDEGFLNAITYHTLGSSDFTEVGLALFAADFLEPGRKFSEDWRRELRGRFHKDLLGVVREILEARLRHLVDRGRPLREETAAFWNRMTQGDGWGSVSEF